MRRSGTARMRLRELLVLLGGESRVRCGAREIEFDDAQAGRTVDGETMHDCR